MIDQTVKTEFQRDHNIEIFKKNLEDLNLSSLSSGNQSTSQKDSKIDKNFDEKILNIEDIKSPLIIEDIESCSSDSLVEEKIFEKIPKNLDSNSQNSNKSTTKNASSKFDSPQLQNMNFSKTFTKIEMKKNTWSQYDDTNPSQEKTLSIV